MSCQCLLSGAKADRAGVNKYLEPVCVGVRVHVTNIILPFYRFRDEISLFWYPPWHTPVSLVPTRYRVVVGSTG